MKNKNTMQPWEYIGGNLLWAVTAMIWYECIFFTALPGMTVGMSRVILWLLVVGFVTFGCITTFVKRRNHVSIAVNMLLPYEFYTVLAYKGYIPKLVWGAVILCSAASLLFLALALAPYSDMSKRKPLTLKRRFQHGLLGSRVIAAVCMLTLIVPLGIRLVFGHGVISADIQSVGDSSKANEWTVENKIETVRLLKEEEWSKLMPQGKLDVLGAVCNIEIRYLGLNHEIYLKSGALDGTVAALYDHRNREIVVDIDHLQTAPAEEILDSLCHECYHSYQYQLVELYSATSEEYRDMLLFQYVDEYMDEFSDYNDGAENMEAYYYQTVEVMARKYASESVEEYYKLIDEYVDTHEGED